MTKQQEEIECKSCKWDKEDGKRFISRSRFIKSCQLRTCITCGKKQKYSTVNYGFLSATGWDDIPTKDYKFYTL